MKIWISVKDRLPEERGRYIIYVDIPEEDYKKVWTIDVLDPKKGFDMPKEYGRSVITHWMPLPEGPNDEMD